MGAVCGVGLCAGGAKECLPDGSGTRCDTQPGGSNDQSRFEVCDGEDNDCNGSTDEGFDVGAACGVAACAGGVKECGPSVFQTRCDTEAGGSNDQSSLEICDGLDNDCNGEADDGITDLAPESVRFQDLPLTIYDCATDLEWEKKVVVNPDVCPTPDGRFDLSCFDPRNVHSTYTWTECERRPGTGCTSGIPGDHADPDGLAFTVAVPFIAEITGGAACDGWPGPP